MYTCFYDLASAVDTVELSVLLEELFNAGVHGRCWRLIEDWHCGLVSQMRLGIFLSRPIYLASPEESIKALFSPPAHFSILLLIHCFLISSKET